MNPDLNTTLNFNLARRMDMARGGGPQIVEGPRGPGLTYDLCVIHNQDDPSGEAESWLAGAVVSHPDRAPGLALVCGLGLGYHLKVLRQKYPGIRLVVFEPVPEMVDVYARHGVMAGEDVDGPPPLILTDWRNFEAAVGRELVHGRRSGVIVVVPEGYKALRPEAFGTFDMFARQEIVRRLVIERTRRETDAKFLQNLAANAGRLPDLPDLMVLKGRLPARPAFLVGSGPSLDQNAVHLRQAESRGLILAGASAVKPLLAYGIRPDVIVVLESSDTSDYLRLSPAEREILGPDAVLALASGCHPAHFQLEGFHQAVFHLTPGAAQTFSTGAFLPQGGNVGTAAFALAYNWGLSPLILVAQDQAYGDGRLHAAGTPGEVTEASPDTFAVKGVGNTVTRTDTGLLASLGWYAEAARTIAAHQPAPPLYNCSAGGAQVPGFTEMPLDALVASLPPAASRLDLAPVLPRLPRTPRSEIEADVTQLAGVVGTLRRLAVRDHGRAAAEIKDAGQVSKFLGQVLAEAAVAEGRDGLIAALDRADGLMTMMLSALLNRD